MTISKLNSRMRYEPLESRRVPAIWGNPWPQAEALSISFVPDGTTVAGQPSRLAEHLNASIPDDAWQLEILRAFQSWAQHANINLHVTLDEGLPLGSSSALQSAPVHGEFRIAAVDLAHEELAVATPFDLFNDWSGEVLINTDYEFRHGGAGDYDLFTVLLQEAGHALSLPNDGDPSSAMFTTYLSPRTGPSTQDAARLQTLYGRRRDDRFELEIGNENLATSTPISFVQDVDQFAEQDPTQFAEPFVVAGDLTTRVDADTYRVVVPPDLHAFSVVLRTSGISLLTAQVSVYDAQGALVQSRQAADPRSGDLELFVDDALGGGEYFVRVTRSADNAFSVGSYRLAVGNEALEAVFPPSPAFLNDDQGDDDDDDDPTVVALPPRSGVVGPRWDAGYLASLSFDADRDHYSVVAPQGATTASAMVVAAWSLESDQLDPLVEVRVDSPQGATLPAEIVRNELGFFAVQVIGVESGRAYHVTIRAADPSGGHAVGNYFLGIDFRPSQLVLPTLHDGEVTAAAPTQVYWLESDRSQLLHFRLVVQDDATPLGATLLMRIFDEDNQLIASQLAHAGETRTFSRLLAEGAYRIEFTGGAENGGPLPDLQYRLDSLKLNDPVGPTLIDGTVIPVGGQDPIDPRPRPREIDARIALRKWPKPPLVYY